jgi:uncharacterized membrane protein
MPVSKSVSASGAQGDLKFEGHVANVVSTVVTLSGGAEVRTVIANPQPAGAVARQGQKKGKLASSL